MKQMRALIREIHRRSLWQVVGIYVAASEERQTRRPVRQVEQGGEGVETL